MANKPYILPTNKGLLCVVTWECRLSAGATHQVHELVKVSTVRGPTSTLILGNDTDRSLPTLHLIDEGSTTRTFKYLLDALPRESGALIK